MVLIVLVPGRCLPFTFNFIRERFSLNPVHRTVFGKEVDLNKVCTKIMLAFFTFKQHSVHAVCVRQRMALFGVLPMVPFVILPMVPLVANGTFGLPMVQLGEPMVPFALPLVPKVLPMVPLVEPRTIFVYHWYHW